MNVNLLKTPAYVLDEKKLIENCKILDMVQKRTGCKILLAQKAFSNYKTYPIIGEYLSGTTASGLFEARLGHEEMHKENHVFAPAFHEDEIDELAVICDHIIFNSFSQVERFARRALEVNTQSQRTNVKEASVQNPGANVKEANTQNPGANVKEASIQNPGANVKEANTQNPGANVKEASIQNPGANVKEASTQNPEANEKKANAQIKEISTKEANAQAGQEREEIPRLSLGLRINPECSTQEGHAIYDPCAKGSRLGVTLTNFEKALEANPKLLDDIEGLHFHTLCEQNSDDLETTLQAVEEKFGRYLYQMKWLNMGGGHHITRADYDIEKLIDLISHMKEKYNLEIYLEPGEAVALNAGYLVTEVMDIVENDISILILDASAACHMPDVLEMPYRPPLRDSGQANEKDYTYRLSSCTCLAGDVIGDYSFDRKIKVGDRLIFEDMAIYSMVKNNTFNGIALPSIYLLDRNDKLKLLNEFGYEDFKMRL